MRKLDFAQLAKRVKHRFQPKYATHLHTPINHLAHGMVRAQLIEILFFVNIGAAKWGRGVWGAGENSVACGDSKMLKFDTSRLCLVHFAALQWPEDRPRAVLAQYTPDPRVCQRRE